MIWGLFNGAEVIENMSPDILKSTVLMNMFDSILIWFEFKLWLLEQRRTNHGDPIPMNLFQCERVNYIKYLDYSLRGDDRSKAKEFLLRYLTQKKDFWKEIRDNDLELT